YYLLHSMFRSVCYVLALIVLTFSPLFFFQCSGVSLVLLSFPTRRSSDLGAAPAGVLRRELARDCGRCSSCRGSGPRQLEQRPQRSEEHTSELQSPYDLVCRLLLEKKKKKNK